MTTCPTLLSCKKKDDKKWKKTWTNNTSRGILDPNSFRGAQMGANGKVALDVGAQCTP